MDAGIDPGTIMLEPEGRNTAPAVLAAALHAAQGNSQELILVLPSDHIIEDAGIFDAAIAAGKERAMAGDIVTFGVKPTHPETGYGYLELETSPKDSEAVGLKQFVEKPNASHATEMLDSGNYLWNAGIFLFRADVLIEAVNMYAPELMTPVQDALSLAQSDLGFLRLSAEEWAQADDISIDYAVMERAKNLSVVPYNGRWSDLGGWDAVWRISSADSDDGVVTAGAASAIDCSETLLRSEAGSQEIVGIGLKNIVAISMPDAVLVADMSRTQDVKKAVSVLKAKGAVQATTFPKDHRPWGWFESLVIGGRFQVKRICVHPGAALSLQSHHHRAEHWIVVEGTAKVTVDEEVKLMTENQSVYIPLGAIHRMENPGKVPMVLIEVQTGAYLGEDDIIRYEDVYARN